MAKVMFIDPRGWQGAVCGCRPYPNAGLAYLVPMLRKNGHQVQIIDLNNEVMNDPEVIRLINKYHPEIIGFSVKTATMKSARSLAQKIKDNLPKVPIILGGPHTTFAWQELLKEPWFDVIFVGEGEEISPIICKRILINKPIEDLPGVITRLNFGNDFSLNHPLILDLDSLPFPEYDLFPNEVIKSISLSYPLLTSRGCIYKCSYCSVPEISGRRCRSRSPVNIIEELKFAKEKYSIREFEIIDDLFNFDMNRCKEICQALIEAELNLTWSCPNGLRADRIDKELAELMFKAGCHSVMVGVESADPRVLRTVNKGETIEDIEKGIHIFQEAGMDVGGYFIIGLPGDSLELQKRSVDFVKRMHIRALFNMFVPYPGTKLWEWAKNNAHFLRDIEDGLHFADYYQKVLPVFETDDFSSFQRLKAYEMVHTRLGEFQLVVPIRLSRLRHHLYAAWLLLRYDFVRLPLYIFKIIDRKIKRLGIFKLFFRMFQSPKKKSFER